MRGSGMGRLLAFLLLFPAVAFGYFQEAGSPSLVSMEAENAQRNVASPVDGTWNQGANTGASGGQMMKSSTSTTYPAPPDTARLEFDVNLTGSGTYYYWFRYRAFGSGSDSLYIEYNDLGDLKVSSGLVQTGIWTWLRVTYGPSLPSGIGVAKIHRREANIEIDKVVLTQDVNYTPTGTGPAESEQPTGSNTSPNLAVIPDQSMPLNAGLTVEMTATDADGDNLAYSAVGLPSFGSLTDRGDGTAYISFASGPSDDGVYNITVTVTDDGSPVLDNSKSFSLTVGEILAFPSAEGYGRFVTGGRGGLVCHVNTLSGSTTGSFNGTLGHYYGSWRYCASSVAVDRTIVFDVAGVINLGGVSPISLAGGDATIAGQTAPGDGVIIRGGGLSIGTDNVIIRHMRMWPGDLGSKAKNGTGDGLRTLGADDIIIDHSSILWGTDENTATTQSSRRITWQWNIIAEGLAWSVSGHPDNNERARAFLVGNFPNRTVQQELSVLGNLFAHYKVRPIFYNNGATDYISNIHYNAKSAPVILLADGGTLPINLVGNYFKAGSDGWGSRRPISNSTKGDGGTYYVESNCDLVYRPTDTESENAIIESGPMTQRVSRHDGPAYPSETTCFDTRDIVPTKVGATKPTRLATETRIINSFINGTGEVIDDPSEVGGWDSIAFTERGASYDTDGDGMSDAWETANGLNPSLGSDGAATAANGYTNLENFINELAGDDVPGGTVDTEAPDAPTGGTIGPD